MSDQSTPTAAEVLRQLKEGNARFVSNKPAPRATDFERLAKQQQPMAVVLGCADSRVPAEIVFDQGPGDLFVVRVAGNIAGGTQIGSIEFAVTQFGTQLVVVLGHANCGAVRATLDHLDSGEDPGSDHLAEILKHVDVGSAAAEDDAARLASAVTANVEATVHRLSARSTLLRERLDAGTLAIRGAEYDLKSGLVRFSE